MSEDGQPPVLPPDPFAAAVRSKPMEPKPPLPYTHGILGEKLDEQHAREELSEPSWATPWSGLSQALGEHGTGLLYFWLSYGLALAFGQLEAQYSPSRLLAPVFQKATAAFDWTPPYWEAIALGPVYGFVVNAANASNLIIVFGFLEAALFIASVMVSARSRVTLGLVTLIVVLLNLLALAKHG